MKRPVESTADFLFEIGCEEIPAGMLPGAAKELQVILDKYLTAQNLANGTALEVYGAPRRIVATCPSLRTKQADEVKEARPSRLHSTPLENRREPQRVLLRK